MAASIIYRLMLPNIASYARYSPRVGLAQLLCFCAWMEEVASCIPHHCAEVKIISPSFLVDDLGVLG